MRIRLHLRPHRRNRSRLAILLGWTIAVAAAADAQRGGRFPRPDRDWFGAFGDPNSFWTPPDFHGNPPYDGRFIFARIKYRGFARMNGREGPGWSHDYPDADVHLMTIMREVTAVRPFTRTGRMIGGAIVALDDPQLFKYPVAYLSEPGGWFPNEAEVQGLRKYLQKGGFVIVDDFDARDWPNFEMQMSRILPELRPVQMSGREPIFDSFYKVDLNLVRTGYGAPAFIAYYEKNDPSKRLLMLANYNADIGEAWQWSGQGFVPVDVSNEAYKLGVNYVIYALTHP